MSGGSRKRDSKWDLKEEARHSLENMRDNAHGKGGVSFSGRRSPRWSPEVTVNNGHRWELPGNRGGRDDDSSAWNGDGNYGTTMSPGLNEWRHHHHRSPKNEWSRSSRIHSRSRSRSRSRSLVRDFRREAEVYERSRSRSAVSSQLCKDYAVGRCRSGNHCHFLHQGSQYYEESWEGRDRKVGSSKYSDHPDSRDFPIRNGRSSDFCTEFEKGSCRRGSSCRFIHHSASIGYGRGSSNEAIGERGKETRSRGSSLERGGERESLKSDIPCKFFAAGNCRNGKHCRFSHHGQARRSPDRRSRDDRWVQEYNSDREKLWESPRRINTDPITDARKLRNDKTGRTNVTPPEPQMTYYSKGELNVNHRAAENDEKEALITGKTDNVVFNRDLTGPTDTQNWLDDVEMSPGLNYGLESSNNVVKEDRDHMNQSSESLRINDTAVCTREVGITQQPGHIPNADMTKPPVVVGELYFKQDHSMKDGNAMALPFTNKNGAAGTPPIQIDLNSSANILPSVSQGFSIAGLNQLISSNKPDTDYTNASQATAGIAPTQNVVSNEQLAHLTNLSVSLAQFFGTGQQLPQLYSTLNSQNAVDMPPAKPEGSVRPNFELAVRVNEDIGVRKQYDPISDSIDPGKHDVSSNPPARPQNPLVQKSITEGNTEATPENIPLKSVAVGPNNENHQSAKSEPSGNFEVNKVKGGETEENKKEVEENANGLLENLDGDEEKADEGKKGKDTKGTRAFKFALVEFVKELLKPAWKDGQIKKEDYKNIVKKAVDKVTSTMQEASIPQTKEKIDQYLSYSKPKLTKLVQAYVEKFQKGTKEA